MVRRHIRARNPFVPFVSFVVKTLLFARPYFPVSSNTKVIRSA
jgi:hypothetical protein